MKTSSILAPNTCSSVSQQVMPLAIEVGDWMSNVMDPTASEAVLKVLDWLSTQQMRCSEVWLFGSQARAAATESSDVDLLVVLGEGEPLPLDHSIREAQLELTARISGELGELVQIQYMPSTEWQHQTTPLARNIRKDGIRLQ
jgi:predicted nucleotidyltransferase